MDKQEAIDFILNELDRGLNQEEISNALSRLLGAPRELVSKFVAQTISRYNQHLATQNPQPQVSTQQSASSSTSGHSLPKIIAPAFSHQATDQSSIGVLKLTNNMPAESIPLPGVYSDSPSAFTNLQETDLYAEQLTALEEFILRELGKHRKQSDIAIRVSESTGMDYKQAQRQIARVAARHHKKIAASQNRLIIPLALIALIAGITLLIASSVEGYTLRFLLVSPNTLTSEQLQDAYNRGQNLPWAFFTGLALCLGGGIGFFSALKEQIQ